MLPTNMERRIVFYVPGHAAPQGSKRHVGGGRMIESSKRLKPWREDVHAAARRAFAASRFEPFTGPVDVRLDFIMPRPKSAPKTKQIPAVKRPDVDKLARAVLDALTGVAFADDSQVVELHARKQLHFQLPAGPGVGITITEGATDG
ncbi:RusA-like Holliday junction resolvase [Gordonia phage TZGordon]|uniref:RusA-like resolvase n=1 Tax=Gordonia phage TZGordon TaxID=2744004 RepID=A0A6N0A8J7_9CAUD|nr:RusA-like Holliday junction resolvase [Gordonia phage TZGordon]QKO02977.1 RusA-like resolvase [Gordonia phage TZGordon]